MRVYSTVVGKHTAYCHDRYGLEADCVLHLADGCCALIEIKLGNKEIEMSANYLYDAFGAFPGIPTIYTVIYNLSRNEYNLYDTGADYFEARYRNDFLRIS